MEEALEQSLEELSRKSDATEAELDAMRKKRRREMREHSNEADALKASVAELQAQAVTLKRSLRETETEGERSTKLIKILEREVTSLKATSEEAAEEAFLMKGEKEHASQALQDANREVTHLKRELKEAAQVPVSTVPTVASIDQTTPIDVKATEAALELLAEQLVQSRRFVELFYKQERTFIVNLSKPHNPIYSAKSDWDKLLKQAEEGCAACG